MEAAERCSSSELQGNAEEISAVWSEDRPWFRPGTRDRSHPGLRKPQSAKAGGEAGEQHLVRHWKQCWASQKRRNDVRRVNRGAEKGASRSGKERGCRSYASTGASRRSATGDKAVPAGSTFGWGQTFRRAEAARLIRVDGGFKAGNDAESPGWLSLRCESQREATRQKSGRHFICLRENVGRLAVRAAESSGEDQLRRVAARLCDPGWPGRPASITGRKSRDET